MKAPEEPSRLLTVAAVMARLDISKDKIYKLMSSGELPFIKLPPYTQQSARRIEEAEVEAFIKRHRQAAS